MKRICVLCKHFAFYGGTQGYSEATPGSDISLDCDKSVWRGDTENMLSVEYRKLMLTAETCKHFELADDVKDLEERP